MSLRRFMHRTRKDEELAEEIESHLAHEQDANGARGLSGEEARRQARLKFGNPRTTREHVWRYRSLPWIENGGRDLRFALQMVATYLGIKGTRGVQQFLPNTFPAGAVNPCAACPSGSDTLSRKGSSP